MTDRLVVVLLSATAACGGGPKTRRAAVAEDFVCKGRRAMYSMTGSLMYAEQGIVMFCDGDRPQAREYFLDDDGNETKREAVISSSVWEKSWLAFENAGWRRLRDCENPSAGEKDPMYTFEVSDGDKTVTMMCKGTELPFPYDTLRTALDSVKGELPADESADDL